MNSVDHLWYSPSNPINHHEISKLVLAIVKLSLQIVLNSIILPRLARESFKCEIKEQQYVMKLNPKYSVISFWWFLSRSCVLIISLDLKATKKYQVNTLINTKFYKEKMANF